MDIAPTASATTSAAAAPEAPAPGASLGVWLLAARPRTLTAAVAPVLVGSALAHRLGGFRAGPALAALLSSIFIQIGTNLANDYSDFKRGADTEARVGPRRVTQSGLVAPRTVKRAALLCFGVAALIGAFLASVAGWPILVIGLASIAAGWLYTGGPWPLGYHGLGDVFVFVFFGLVATTGTVYVQLLRVPREALLAAVPVGCFATAILVVNNLRDRGTDAAAGKRTLAVKLGVAATRAQYLLIAIIAFATIPLLPGRPLALLALPLLWPPLRRVFQQEGAALNPALGETARLQLVAAALMAGGLLL
jgi:1,4-dihydroxy-2-naphthoate octaprenyltransferase